MGLNDESNFKTAILFIIPLFLPKWS